MKIQNGTHGGNIYKEARAYGLRKDDILDYSANINPLGVPETLRQMIISNIDNIANYPDPEYTELREDISKYLGTSAERIFVGNGASEVIYLVFDILRPKKVLVPAPAFSEYSRAAENFGSEVVYFERKEEDGFNLDIDKLINSIEDGVEAVLLCNPNNPTSTIVSKSQMKKLIEACSRLGVYAIIDEAFIELTEGANYNSVVNLVNRYNNLFVIRAFTKLFAIPGLRLGYGVGNKDIIWRMNEKRIPWSVNSLACCAGKLLSTNSEYMNRTTVWLKEEKDWLYRQISEIRAFKVFEPKANFILVKVLANGLNANVLKDKLISRGILIRHAGNFKFLDDKFFRVAVKDRVSNMRFMKELREIVKEWEI